MAEALYRKYRPQVFEDVVGQEHIERTIKNAISQDKVSHAYLFTGPRGTGKTTTARILAKALLCESGPTSTPDSTCDDCTMIAAGEHPDVYELDAASRTGVENVREEIIGRVQFAPTRGRYKIYIIDEVHMLSTAAFNALLKTLEEPPDHVVFILATTDPQKVPETIHSRCQRFDFRRISNEAIVSRLGAVCVEEGVEFEGDALELIAHRAEGGMRDALTSLEQLIAFGEGKVTLEVAERVLGSLATNDLAEIVHFVGTRDIAACFRWTADFVETGADLAQFTRDFAEHIRNMYVMSLAGTDVGLDISDAAAQELAAEATLFGSDRLARLLGVLGDLSVELKTSSNPRLSFEIALTRMVRPDSDLTLESLAERIEALEAGQVATLQVATTQRETASDAAPIAAHAEEKPEVQADVSDATDEREISAPPKEPPSFSGEGLANPATLQRMWQVALENLKKAKTAYGVLFLNTKVYFDESKGELVIVFSKENEFAFKTVQKPEVQEELSDALAKAYGARVPFVLKKLADETSGTACDIQSETRVQSQPASEPVHVSNDSAKPQHETQPAQPDQPEFSSDTIESRAEFQSDKAGESEVEPVSEPQRETRLDEEKSEDKELSVDELNELLAFGFGDDTQFSEVCDS